MKNLKWVSFLLIICILAGSLMGCTGAKGQKETNGKTEQNNGDTTGEEDNSADTPAASGKVT